MTDMEISDEDIVNALEGFGPEPLSLEPITTTQVPLDNLDYSGADVVSLTSNSKEYTLTGRPPTQLYLSCDPDTFSDYQVLIRKNVEVFEAREEDVTTNAQGRNKPIVLGQVGIRCIHCARIPPGERARGAMYYPSKLDGLYQAAQNLANSHLLDVCPFVPATVRAEMCRLKEKKSSAGGGKSSWAERLTALGVYEDDCGLRFANRIDALRSGHHHHHHHH